MKESSFCNLGIAGVVILNSLIITFPNWIFASDQQEFATGKPAVSTVPSMPKPINNRKDLDKIVQEILPSPEAESLWLETVPEKRNWLTGLRFRPQFARAELRLPSNGKDIENYIEKARFLRKFLQTQDLKVDSELEFQLLAEIKPRSKQELKLDIESEPEKKDPLVLRRSTNRRRPSRRSNTQNTPSCNPSRNSLLDLLGELAGRSTF
jgi:hypothetical protein